MRRAPPFWAAAEIEILRAGWDAGDPASVIARRLPGRSRNSVIGKANRMKLDRRFNPGSEARKKPGRMGAYW